MKRIIRWVILTFVAVLLIAVTVWRGSGGGSPVCTPIQEDQLNDVLAEFRAAAPSSHLPGFTKQIPSCHEPWPTQSGFRQVLRETPKNLFLYLGLLIAPVLLSVVLLLDSAFMIACLALDCLRRRIVTVALTTTFLTWNAFAQQLPRSSDYAQAAQILKGDAPAKPSIKSTARRRPPTITGTIDNNPVEVQRQAPLPPSARTALAMSENWLNSGPPPVASPNGRVLYAYGEGVPTIVCAILQVCEMDLEPGEVASKETLDLGDNRFLVTTRTVGSGTGQFTYVVIKPTMPGLDTTMTVGTNKRPYYVRLVSTAHEHMARVAFRYPEDEEKKRQTELAAKKAEEDRRKTEADRLAKLNTAKPIRNWSYQVKLHGKDARYLRPQKIGDDGVHTHISLSEEARHRGLPVVQLRDARGPIPANVRWEGNELIVDAVFQHACLLEGVGKKQQRACITNEGLNPEEGSLQ